ncbi:MAG: hypothetical protein AMXMBFR83_27340 [Phycisphaerae bacterium]
MAAAATVTIAGGRCINAAAAPSLLGLQPTIATTASPARANAVQPIRLANPRPAFPPHAVFNVRITFLPRMRHLLPPSPQLPDEVDPLTCPSGSRV